MVTEGILPKSWGYDASDFKHIKSIHRKYGNQKFRTFPKLTISDYILNNTIRGFKKVNLLNLIDYSKKIAIETLENKIGWEYYGGKHYESTFTQFFQGYVLPKKFGFDKRRAHLSSLICSGQITRNEAIRELEKPIYDPILLDSHIEYTIKKWEISRSEFDYIMSKPPKKHSDFSGNANIIKLLVSFKKLLKI